MKEEDQRLKERVKRVNKNSYKPSDRTANEGQMYRRLKIAICILVLFILLISQMTVVTYAQNADSPSEAIELTIGVPYNEAISPAGDEDWYKFNADAGSTYVIETFNLGISMDTVIILYSSDQTFLDYDDDSGSERFASKIVHTFNKSGIYYIRVIHFDTIYGVGTYTILVRPPTPPKMMIGVFDRSTDEPLLNATVSVYDPVTYNLLAENRTLEDGITTITFQDLGYYLVIVVADGYHDAGGLALLRSEGTNRLNAFLEHVSYTGLVSSSALIRGIMAPNVDNTLMISLYNSNSSYSITLLDVTVQFPWFGLYEGHWQGNTTIQEGMPLKIDPERSWNYTLKFRAPSDSRAYLNPATTFGSVSFHIRAPAWKSTILVEDGIGIVVRETLVTVDVDPIRQARQGFQTSITGVTLLPSTDPNAISRLDSLSTALGETNLKLDDLSTTLKSVSSKLDGTERRLGDINTQLKSLNSRFDNVGTDIADILFKTDVTNIRLDTLNTQLKNTNTELGVISSQLQSTNSRLDDINDLLLSEQRSTRSLLSLLFGDIQNILYILIGILIILVVINLLYLNKIAKQISRTQISQTNTLSR